MQNGLVPNAPRLERLCGTVPAGTQIKSSGNTMTVIFATDASVSNGGFTADYSSEEEAGKNLSKHSMLMLTILIPD